MRLLPPLVAGLLFHLVFVWVELGDPWVSLLVLVLVACLLASARGLAEAAAYNWVRSTLSRASQLVSAVAGLLADDDPWDALTPVLSVAATSVGWAVVQFVELGTQDVIARVVLLASALVILALDVASARCRRPRGPGGGGGTDAQQPLSASVPLPKALGGDKGNRLKFTLDL